MLPNTAFDWRARPDAIAAELRAKPEVMEDIQKHMQGAGKASVANDYFCSQLVGMLLFAGQLIDADPGIITPCALFDQLAEAAWRDVSDSDYAASTQAMWQRQSKQAWQRDYDIDSGMIEVLRRQLFVSGYLSAAQARLESFTDTLGAVSKKLTEMSSR